MTSFRTNFLLAGALACCAAHAVADPLVGDVGAAYSTAEAAGTNPANAAFLDRTQASFAPELFKSESLSVRYPGFEPTTLNENGLGGILNGGRPGFIYKPSPRFGIGGYFVPPIGIELQIHKQKIPVLILGQQSYIDLDAVGKLDGAGQVIVGYKFTDRLGLGLDLSMQAITFDATLTPSDGGDPLATIKGSQSDINAVIGVRFDVIPAKFSVGVAFGLVNLHKQTTDIQSPLIGGADPGAAAKSDGANAQLTTPLNNVIFGFQAGLGTRLHLLADFDYTRVNTEATGFSLVDLKTKRKDLHDTLAVRAGAILGWMDGGNLLVGFRYEPSSIGPGAKGADGSIGFGTMEVVQIFTGFASMAPYWQVATGIQRGFSPKSLPKTKKDDGPRGYYQWTVAVGIGYRRSSLGIDENGELPGAYLYTKTFIPASVTYKF